MDDPNIMGWFRSNSTYPGQQNVNTDGELRI